MFIVIPHVGKSHLTRETVFSIPEEHQIILIDASFVADMSEIARMRPSQIRYIRPPEEERPTCLARNWNIGAAAVPKEEPYWLYCASDIQFSSESWMRIEELERCYPDAGILRDSRTNWNVWLVRRWAWDILAPMDEQYKPCAGEDDDLVMKCWKAGIKIRAGRIGVSHLEGGHATRVDIANDLRGTTWKHRNRTLRYFGAKWGCIPSKVRDETYKTAMRETHIGGRRSCPPKSFAIPSSKPVWPEVAGIEAEQLHLGCGKRRKEGFVNVDANPRFTEADLHLDVVRDPWPFKSGSTKRIESYHMIEHLSRAEGEELLRRCFDALEPGGVLVLECPDLAALCAAYPVSPKMRLRNIYGRQNDQWNFHKWGYDRTTLKQLLEGIGFSSVTTGEGTDYHSKEEPCMRAEAIK